MGSMGAALQGALLLGVLVTPSSAWIAGGPLNALTSRRGLADSTCSVRSARTALVFSMMAEDAKAVRLGPGLFAPDIQLGDSPDPEPELFQPLPKAEVDAIFGTVMSLPRP
jgi:hypothetical protein